jgi:hypothetical protein
MSRLSAEPMVIAHARSNQQSAKARSATNRSTRVGHYAIDERIPESLMIPFELVMRDKLVHRASEMLLAHLADEEAPAINELLQ